MRFLTRSLVALFFAALSVAALGYAGASFLTAVQSRSDAPGGPGAGREREFTVRVMTVSAEDVEPVLSAFGEVRTRRSLELRAPVGGRVLELGDGVEDGAQVTQGQLLFRIDPSDAESALALAQSELSRDEAELRDAERALDLAAEDVDAARAQLELRERALARQMGLAERGVITDSALEDAELAVSTARQSVVSRRQAEAQAEARRDQALSALDRQRITLAEAERRLADTSVHAGFDGVLADIAIAEGGLVNANEQLGRIIDPQALEVSVQVSTAQYLRLIDDSGALRDTQAEVALEVAGYEITSPGQLMRASATVEQGQSGRRLFVNLDAPRGFRPGDFVTVRLQEPALANVAMIPATAVTTSGNVLAVNDSNRLEALPVNLLRRQGDSVIVELDGIEGREIVREVGPNLGSGILVRPHRDGEAQAPAAAEAPEMVSLDAERRARLIAQVEGNSDMPDPVRARMLAQLSEDEVPAAMVERLENGGDTRTQSGG